MNAIKEWMKAMKENRDLRYLLFIGGLYYLSIALSNTFVNVFLWKQSKEYFDIGIYNLAIVCFQLIALYIAGAVAKRIDRVIVLRIGVIFLSLFFIAVLICGNQATNHLLLLGGLLGVGYGFYWLAFNVLTFEITEPESRDFFNGFLGALTSAGGIIAPVFAGYVISRMENITGYMVIFSLSLILFSIAVFLSFFLKRRSSQHPYRPLEAIHESVTNRNWKWILYAHFFQGLREGTFMFVVSIYVFLHTESELSLGNFTMLNSITSCIMYYIVSKYSKPRQRQRAIFFGALILYGSIGFLIFQVSYLKLLIYAVLIGIGYPLLLVPYSSITYDVIGKARNIAAFRIEYIVIRELFLLIGRIVSILAFILTVWISNSENSLSLLLLLLGLGHPMISFFTRRIHIE